MIAAGRINTFASRRYRPAYRIVWPRDRRFLRLSGSRTR